MVNDPKKVLRDFRENRENIRSDFHIMPAGFSGTPVQGQSKDGQEELLGKKKDRTGKVLLFLVLIILFCLILFDE